MTLYDRLGIVVYTHDDYLPEWGIDEKELKTKTFFIDDGVKYYSMPLSSIEIVELVGICSAYADMIDAPISHDEHIALGQALQHNDDTMLYEKFYLH